MGFGYASILCAYTKSDGFEVPVFPFQAFIKKIGRHNILWPAIFLKLKDILIYLKVKRCISPRV